MPEAQRSRTRIIVGILFCLTIVIPVTAAELHLIAPNTWTKQPVSPTAMNQRVETAAIEYRRYAPIPRAAFVDIAYPVDAQEYHSLDGYGVLLLVVFSQDRNELPPKRLYAPVRGREIELSLISSTSSKQDPDTAAAVVFGTNRWEALYEFPVYLGRKARDLRIDFAAHRDGFAAYKFSGREGDHLDLLPVRKPQASRPSNRELTDFILREYPGFVRR